MRAGNGDSLASLGRVAGATVSNLEDQAAADQLGACPPLVRQLASMTESLVRQINGLSIGWLRSQADKTIYKSPANFANSDAALSQASFLN
jgi:hypothetical protein